MDDYPKSLPIVWELDGRIPRNLNHHVFPKHGNLCVTLPDAYWLEHDEARLLEYLDGPLKTYFIAHTIYERSGKWPLGEWGHDERGYLEFYGEQFDTDDRRVITEYLRCLSRPAIKGHWSCPCGSGRRLRRCHASLMRDLHNRIPPTAVQRAFRFVESHEREVPP